MAARGGRDLGQFEVPVQWTPPSDAKPGDIATLKFMQSVMQVYVPDSWQAGQPIAYNAPPTAQPGGPTPTQPGTQPPQKASGISCEQLCGIATAGVGIFGLFAGSVYVGTIIPGSLGFSLGFCLLLVAVGLWVLFERLTRRALAFSQLQAVLLSAAILMTGASLGVSMMQGLSNYVAQWAFNHFMVYAMIYAWIFGHTGLIMGALWYMRTLRRFGEVGSQAATSFLPWFIIVTSYMLVGITSVVLLVDWAKADIGHPLVHAIALATGGLAVSLGCVAPRFEAWMPPSDAQPGGDGPASTPQRGPDSTALLLLLPSVAASLVVCQLCVLSAVGTEAQHDAGGPTPQFGHREIYSVFFLVVLAASGHLDDLLCGYALLLQLACLGALTVMSAVEPLETSDAQAQAWLAAALAFLAVQYASFAGRKAQPEAEAGEASGEAAETTEEATFVGIVGDFFKTLITRNYKGFLRLGGVLLVTTVATARTLATSLHEPGFEHSADPTVGRMLGIAFPAILLALHVLLRGMRPAWFDDAAAGTWDVPTAALLGLSAAATFIRLTHSRSSRPEELVGSVLWDLSLIVYPAAILGISCALFPLNEAKVRSQAAFCSLIVALWLMCISLCCPLALGVYGGAAFYFANPYLLLRILHSPFVNYPIPFYGPEFLVIVALFWVWRGAYAIRAGSDEHLLVAWEERDNDFVSAILVAVVACGVFLAGMWQTKAEEGAESTMDFFPRLLLYSALLPTYFVCLLEWMPLLPMVCAVVGLEMRPRWDTCLACGLVLLLGRPFGLTFELAALSTSLLMAIAAARLTFLAGADRHAASTAAWVVALVCVLPASTRELPAKVLAALPLSGFTITLLTTPLPLLQPAFYVLPGLWTLQILWKTGASFNDACLAALVAGAVLMPLPALAERFPQALRGVMKESKHLEEWLELAGLIWVILGAWLGLYYRDDFWQLFSIAVPMGVGMTELVLGLTYAQRARNRRLGGLVSISISIFLAAGMTAGLLQGLLTLLGSLMTIGMAVLVATFRGGDAEASDNDNREILLDSQPPLREAVL